MSSTPLSISHAELIVFALWARWKVFQQELLDWLREKNASLEQTVIERTEWARSMEHDLAPGDAHRPRPRERSRERACAALLIRVTCPAAGCDVEHTLGSRLHKSTNSARMPRASKRSNEQLERAREVLEAQFQRDRAEARRRSSGPGRNGKHGPARRHATSASSSRRSRRRTSTSRKWNAALAR